MQEDYHAPRTTGQQIEWICDVYKSPIDNTLGGVWISCHHIRKASTPSPQAGANDWDDVIRRALEDRVG